MGLLSTLKDNHQDFEWYSTTEEILNCIKRDMCKHFDNAECSVLDCGAGDGRVLNFLTSDKKYAIEKSKILIDNMSSDIFILGTDFEQSTLIDKKVDVIFCNPPYSEYEKWASKIINEANSYMLYLVLPKRWANLESISNTITQREAEVKVIGNFDFFNAERQARAEVEIISIKLYYGSVYSKRVLIDPFYQWFNNYFDFDKETNSIPEEEPLKDRVNTEIVGGNSLIPILVNLYDKDIALLCENYKSVSLLDKTILKELDVDVSKLKESLKQKITGLKYKYWQELFNNFTVITNRLTVKSRKRMMDMLMSNTSIDFTESNIYAVTIWVIKNANQYFDKQLIDLVENMTNKANIKLYKSNKRTFGDEKWRYCRIPDGLTKYALELRIVVARQGGIRHNSSIHTWNYTNNLNNTAHDFLSDICTVADNLGFKTNTDSKLLEWESGSKQTFEMTDGTTLMEVKAFINGNIHIKFNQKFIRKLNVEFGRLKGWLKDKREACEELEIDIKSIEWCFKSNYKVNKVKDILITYNTNI